MKVRIVVGVLLCTIGVVFLLQGVNLLHGSTMSGQTQWAVTGALAILIGLANLAVALRNWRRRSTQ